MDDEALTIKNRREALQAKIANGMSYTDLARELGISKGALWKFLNDDYVPTSTDLRRALGIPLIASVTAIDGEVEPGSLALASKQCPKCGRHFVPNSNRKYCFFCSPYRGNSK